MSKVASEGSAQGGAAPVSDEPVLKATLDFVVVSETRTPGASGNCLGATRLKGENRSWGFGFDGVMFGVYTGLLWFVMGQKAVYLGLLKDLGVRPLARRAQNLHRH